MAQSLESRINAALRSAARLKDVETVISEVEAEIAATTKKFDAETARSVDPALTTPEAREARNNAADLEHDIRRLNASLGMLQKTRQKLIEDDDQASRRAAYNAARDERDALALHIRARYPEIAMELVGLVKRIDASNRQIAAANDSRPRGAAPLLLAEFLARECGHYWGGGAPVTFLGKIELPLLAGSGSYLPIDHRATDGANAAWERKIEQDRAFAASPIKGIEAKPEPQGATA